MAIVSFNFSKISAERKPGAKGKINISNNVSIKDIEKHEITAGKDHGALKFTFTFESKYAPSLGSIQLEGAVVYMEDAKKIKKLLDDWKKDKKLDKEVTTEVLNFVLAKANIKAIILSQDLNMPPPVPLPKVQPGSDTKQYIG